MSLKATMATFQRVLRQLRHDKRTMALLLFIPSFILIILYFVLYDLFPVFQEFAPLIMVMMAFTALFVVASIATLRERSAGTLDRLMTLPIAKADIVLGYAIAFGLMALLQSLISIFITLGILGVDINGTIIQLIILTVLSGLSGMSFGLFISGFARSEFQAVQFMPAFVFPQFLTSGLLVPRDQMVEALQVFANITPLTYVVDGAKEIFSSSEWSSELLSNMFVLVFFILLALSLGTLTIKRQR